VRAGRLGQRRQRGLERQVRGAAGEHTGEERLDEAVHDLAAEAPADVVRHRHVAVPVEGRQYEVLTGPVDALRGDDTGPGEVVHVAGHAHELTVRLLPDLAPGPDRRRGHTRRHDLLAEPGVLDQPGGPAPVGVEGLGALVDRDARHLGDRQLPAEPGRRLQDRHPDRLVAELERRRQPRDTTPDDDHMGLSTHLILFGASHSTRSFVVSVVEAVPTPAPGVRTGPGSLAVRPSPAVEGGWRAGARRRTSGGGRR
jgi:hypothetical protein